MLALYGPVEHAAQRRDPRDLDSAGGRHAPGRHGVRALDGVFESRAASRGIDQLEAVAFVRQRTDAAGDGIEFEAEAIVLQPFVAVLGYDVPGVVNVSDLPGRRHRRRR